MAAAVWLVLWATLSIPWTGLTATPQWDRLRPLRIDVDRVPVHLLNFAFYLPVAPLASRFGAPLPAAFAAGVAFSVAAEGSQLYSADRVPDLNDLFLNVAGTLVGAATIGSRARRRDRGR